MASWVMVMATWQPHIGVSYHTSYVSGGVQFYSFFWFLVVGRRSSFSDCVEPSLWRRRPIREEKRGKGKKI